MLYKYEEDYVEQEADYSIELLKQLATNSSTILS